MAKNKVTAPKPEKNPYDKISEINFRFGKASKLQPAGMENVTMNTEVTVVLKGKISSFSNGEPWDEGKRFSLQMTACEIMKPSDTQGNSLEDALQAANAARKKMSK